MFERTGAALWNSKRDADSWTENTSTEKDVRLDSMVPVRIPSWIADCNAAVAFFTVGLVLSCVGSGNTGPRRGQSWKVKTVSKKRKKSGEAALKIVSFIVAKLASERCSVGL